MGLLRRKNYPAKKTASSSSRSDYSAGYDKITERQLQETGLRGRKLFFVVLCLVLLWLVSIATFICNVLILVVLKINHRGMSTLQFQTLDNGEHVVQFVGQHTHLGTVVQKSGVVRSPSSANFEIDAEKINFTNKQARAASELVLERDKLRINKVDNFYVADPKTLDVIFDAAKPTFKLQKSIKSIAAATVITNKVRAPIDKHLRIDVQNLMFRGNEHNSFSGRNLFLRAHNSIILRTSEDGAMNFTAAKGCRFSAPNQMQISESPAISANLLGRRLCACEKTGKLFSMPGNKPCALSPTYCQ